MISDNNPALLVALRQLFPDQAREIWVLVHGAGALVNQAALLEFAKRQSTRGDGVTFISSAFPLTSIRQSHGARWLVGRWVRMFVVQFVVMALYQRGWSRSELIAATYSRNRTRACAGEASVR